MNAEFTLTLFTPGEAEKITGLSTVMQRDWRHRGFLPKNDGHARFDVFDLAGMLAMKLLAERGVGPQSSSEIAHWCAAGIVWPLLGEHEAWEGDHMDVLEWSERPSLLRPRMSAEEKLAILRKYRERHGLPQVTDEERPSLLESLAPDGRNWDWGEKSEWLRKQLFRRRGIPFTVAPFFIWWADGTHVFHKSVSEAFGECFTWDPRVSGAIVVLDLAAVGGQMLERCSRPVIHLELPRDPASGEIVAPIEYGAAVPLNPDRPS